MTARKSRAAPAKRRACDEAFRAAALRPAGESRGTGPCPARAGACRSRPNTGLPSGGRFPSRAEARLQTGHGTACRNAERRRSAPGDPAPNRFETQFNTTFPFGAASLDRLSRA